MRIDLRIDRLLLEGLPIRDPDAAAIEVSLRAQLTQLLTDEVLAGSRPMNSGALSSIKAHDITFASTTGARDLGLRLAGAIHGAIVAAGHSGLESRKPEPASIAERTPGHPGRGEGRR